MPLRLPGVSSDGTVVGAIAATGPEAEEARRLVGVQGVMDGVVGIKIWSDGTGRGLFCGPCARWLVDGHVNDSDRHVTRAAAPAEYNDPQWQAIADQERDANGQFMQQQQQQHQNPAGPAKAPIGAGPPA